MNAILILLFGMSWLIFAYFWYGNIIKRKLNLSNDEIATPAVRIHDQKDYVPTKTPILFGHHFSSIAGAGPIIGPIIAFAFFGWLPAILWILLGSVFIGAVQDYTTLMVSVRNNGISIVEIANKVISQNARNLFGIFVWLTLTLLQTVFIDLTADTFVEMPEIVLPSIGLLPIAILFGYFVYKIGTNNAISTFIALLGLFVLIIIGDLTPIKASYDFWLIFLLVYCFLAATLPVWILLQPRDYLSMYLLIAGIVLGILGLLFSSPVINAPMFLDFNSKKGPLFPILFITIACGAISGFHSLVASGTSAKQLNKEHNGKRVAFGGMLLEALLALIVVLLVSSILSWNSNPSLNSEEFNFQFLFSKNPNIAFGTALGKAVTSLGIPLQIGIAFGILMLNSFILTTLDTTTRINRYLIQETLGIKYGKIWNNKYFAAASSIIIAYILCKLHGYEKLWLIFGASNQLIGTLALFVLTAYFCGVKAPKWYTLIPAILMLIITESALIYQLFYEFLPKSDYVLSAICGLLIFLGFLIALETFGKVFKLNKEK